MGRLIVSVHRLNHFHGISVFSLSEKLFTPRFYSRYFSLWSNKLESFFKNLKRSYHKICLLFFFSQTELNDYSVVQVYEVENNKNVFNTQFTHRVVLWRLELQTIRRKHSWQTTILTERTFLEHSHFESVWPISTMWIT